MIYLRKLIVEHPDLAYYKANGYSFSSEKAIGIFTILKDWNNGNWFAAVGKPNGDIITTEDYINTAIKNSGFNLNDAEYDIPAVHPALIDILKNLKITNDDTTTYQYRNDRPDIPVNARVWKNKTVENITHIVSFWCRRPLYEKYKSYVDKALKILNVDPKKCMYETIEFPNKWFTYEQMNSADKTDEKEADIETIKKLMKIQHLNPNAKKALKQIVNLPPDKLQWIADKTGTTVAALRAASSMDESQNLQESPDNIYVIDNDGDTINLNYVEHDDVVCVVCFGSIGIGDGKPKKGWIAGSPQSGKTFYNGKEMLSVPYDGETHDDLLGSFYDVMDMDYFRGIHMRLFLHEGKYYAAFWETLNECKSWKKEILNCLSFFTKDKLKNVMVQFEEMNDDEFVSLTDAFELNKKIKRTKSKAAAKLAKQLHLMGAKEKAEFLKKIGAMQPDKIQIAADKLGMTPIELKQVLGMDIAENSLGNLSFSDYNDPSIPYEAKPRTAIGFDYGTVFERFTRLRKRFC